MILPQTICCCPVHGFWVSGRGISVRCCRPGSRDPSSFLFHRCQGWALGIQDVQQVGDLQRSETSRSAGSLDSIAESRSSILASISAMVVSRAVTSES